MLNTCYDAPYTQKKLFQYVMCSNNIKVVARERCAHSMVVTSGRCYEWRNRVYVFLLIIYPRRFSYPWKGVLFFNFHTKCVTPYKMVL